MANPGLRVKKNFVRPKQELIEPFRSIPVANIGDSMNRINCMNSRIRPMNTAPLLGCALTVKVRTGDNLLMHQAIDMAGPGDIIVVDAQNEQSYAITGELMISWMRRRGIAGLVVDGCIRDIDAVRNLTDFPVYATGITPNGPLKEGGGEVNFPIMCGGLIIHPGDILVGDADGIVVINPQDAKDVLAKARAKNDAEVREKEAIENLTWDRAWVEATLLKKGCEFID
ncbi:RraA family protein [Pelobacter seleniigenes]|uniref:RraA family protein n=1 Tax=Pelobacter seleniigenes TaxID=407188 RepID=UPI0004A6B44E|nr:RraA family protein [Pelobacter seleniigenes]